MTDLQRCRSCGAPIRWAVLNGRPHPVDAEQVPGGNIVLEDEEGLLAHGTVTDGRSELGVPRARIVRPDPQVIRYVSHFATCPDRLQWQARGDGRRRNAAGKRR